MVLVETSIPRADRSLPAFFLTGYCFLPFLSFFLYFFIDPVVHISCHSLGVYGFHIDESYDHVSPRYLTLISHTVAFFPWRFT